MRGRKPLPTRRKVLEGNPGKRRLNTREPVPRPVDDAFDEPPDIVAAVPDAAVEWRRLAPMLRRGHQITETDRTALMALCLEWARYLEALTHAHPRIIKAPSGYAMPNPWLAIQHKALSACLKLWPELGLTPSARSRVTMTPGGGIDDAFAEFDDPPPAVAH